MFYSLKGYVDVVKSDYIVLDVHDVCYQITVSHPSDYKVDELVRVFTYQVVREDEQYLVGFKSIEEKEIFMSLISVKGIGPRTAINALSQTTPNQIIDAIRNSNVVFLKKLPGIGAKAAAQIILDLKGEVSLVDSEELGLTSQAIDAKEALKNLGFKNAQIDEAFKKININQETSQIIRDALAIMGWDNGTLIKR